MTTNLRCWLSSLALAPFALAQSPITPGNILVSRVGDGAAALSNAATARFLDEYTPTGFLVQTIALPTAAVLPQRALTNSGTATSEGFLSQSADGNYFILVGYDAVAGTASVVSTPSASVSRVIGRIGLDGSVDTTTGLGDAYSANNIRSACSDDGTSFWTAGTASSPANGQGVRYVAALGDSTSLQVSTTITNIRGIGIANGQLYCSSQSGSFLGVSTVGTGLPTTSGETITAIASATGNSSYDFFFADAQTLYVADDRNNASGGIQKWTESGGVWTLAFTLQPAVNTGCRGISGYTQAGVTTLFATTSASAPTVVSVVDAGPGSPFTTVVASISNTAFRDVQFVRSPSQVIYSGTDCANTVGTPTQTPVGGYPVAGNANFGILGTNCVPSTTVVFAIQLAGPLPFGYAPFGVDAPPCALAYLFPDALVYLTADPSGSFL
ncbi:MAG: hypothetical protein JNL12_15535, partial [Planctomycetes bacterium]|nr:hypothetical protein [Planctomycetota bacterium]